MRMKNIFIVFSISLLLAGCMPASNQSNGYHQYIKGEGLGNEAYNMYETILFITKDTGFLGGTSYIINHLQRDSLYSKKDAFYWKTEDGGHNWQGYLLAEGGDFQLLQQNKNRIYGLVNFHTELRDSSVIFQSDDQGESWSEKVILDIYIRDFHFADSLHGVVNGGKSGGVYYFFTTVNGGKTWEKFTPQGSIEVHQIDDSIVYYVSRPTERTYYLAGWNYIKKEQVFNIKIPNITTDYAALKYADHLLAFKNEKKLLSIYELTPDYALKFLHTFNRSMTYVSYMVKRENKMYIRWSYNQTDYIYFSNDGGKTWSKRNYYSITKFGPQCALQDGDTLRLWLQSFNNYMTYFKN